MPVALRHDWESSRSPSSGGESADVLHDWADSDGEGAAGGPHRNPPPSGDTEDEGGSGEDA